MQQYTVTIDQIREIKAKLPVGDYFTINSDEQSITLHDIVTHQPLQGTATPPGILAEAELQHGLTYLREQGHKGALTVQLLLAPHGSADDFTNIQNSYGSLLDAAPAVAFEMSSLERENKEITARGLKPHLTDHPGRRAFQQAELAWVQRAGKILLPCELAFDNRSTLTKSFIHLWNEVYEPTLQDKTLAPEVRNAAALVAEAAYQRSRQPAILARMGYLLKRLHEQRFLPAGPLRLPLIIGSWHEHDRHRLADMSVPNEVFKTAPTTTLNRAQWDAFGTVIMNMAYSSRATLDDLGFVPPYIVH